MNPTDYIGRDVLEVLSELREQQAVVEYAKLEDQENLILKEKGLVFFSKPDTGRIYGCRIYFNGKDGYFPAEDGARGKFSEVKILPDLDKMFGVFKKEFRPLNLGEKSLTLYGRQYADEKYLVTGYSEDRVKIDYLHISEIS